MPIPYQGLTDDELLLEASRSALINASRSVGKYRGDTSRGQNRFQRKKWSKVATTVKQYNQINMNNLFKQDELLVHIPVVGETDNYTVSVKLNGVVSEIAKNVKNNKNVFEFRTVVQAVTKVFNTGDVFVKCSCDDYKYRFKHWNILNKVDTEGTDKDPGPGRGIRNPHDDKGRGCKHVLLVLANMDWVMKVASVINNYVNYAAEKLPKPFMNIIFPKLYGVTGDEAVEANIVESEEDLKSTADLIDKINTWGRTRGLKQNKGKPAPEPDDEEQKSTEKPVPTKKPEEPKEEKEEENSEKAEK